MSCQLKDLLQHSWLGDLVAAAVTLCALATWGALFALLGD